MIGDHDPIRLTLSNTITKVICYYYILIHKIQNKAFLGEVGKKIFLGSKEKDINFNFVLQNAKNVYLLPNKAVYKIGRK